MSVGEVVNVGEVAPLGPQPGLTTATTLVIEAQAVFVPGMELDAGDVRE